MTAIVTTVFTGDTIQPQVTFRDWAPIGSIGNVVDPSQVSFNVYDSNNNVILAVPSGDVSVVRESPGIYHRDYTIPAIEGKYIIEFVGVIIGEPTVVRQIISAKFKPQ